MDSIFGPPLTQHGRLIQLTTPLGPDRLLALRAHGVERIGRTPRYTLDVVVPHEQYTPEKLIGQAVSLAILLDDGTFAQRHGFVESLRYLGSDGGLHDWQLVFAPWFHLLEYRSDCRIWQEKTLTDILENVFSHYPEARGAYQLRLSREYPKLSYVTQFNETDANFVQRWCEREGIYWYVEHHADKHRIVFTDDIHSIQALAPQSVRFHTQSATEKQDGITQWSVGAQVLSGQLHWRSNNYRCHEQPRESVMYALKAASAPEALEQYHYRGQYDWSKPDHGNWLSRVAIEQKESAARCIQGQGGVRQLQAGRWFELTQHPLYDRTPLKDRQFLLIDVEFFAESNLPIPAERRDPPGSLGELIRQTRGEPSSQNEAFFHSRFECQRYDMPYRSAFDHAKPANPGPQTAMVVTPEDHEVFTDELNRVCVRFHWDRLSEDGQLSSCWIRMLQSSSGPDWGSVHVPRAGEEVVVSYLDNDIDKPLIMGQVYGGHRPAWHSSGLMSGHKSKEIKGNGFNQWVMDDSTGQVRTQLHSSHGHSQLNLGYLIDQRGNNRGALRGSGFELRTDNYGALRAQQGLHLTTHGRSNAQSGQIDAKEAQNELKSAEQRLQTLSDTAQTHNADTLQAGLDSLTQLNQDADIDYGNGDNSGSGQGKTAGFKQPLMLVSSPADIATVTPKNSHLHSGQHLNVTTGQDINLASGQSLLASVAQRISLFAQNAGIKLFAAKGKVEIQAQSDDMELTAQKAIRITSTAGCVEVAAQDGILLTSGGAYIRIKDGNIEIHAPGTIDVKGAKKVFSGPASLSHSFKALPTATALNYDTQFKILWDASDIPASNMRYRIVQDDGSLLEGITDPNGGTNLLKSQVPEGAVVEILGDA